MLETAVVALHLIISIGLMATVMLQSGKSAGLGTIGGGAESLFGRKKGLDEVLNRATGILAAVFMGTSLVLTVMRQ